MNNKIIPQQINGLKMTQFPVNSNIATVGHKLQGQTKQHPIITSWNFEFKNWVYVVLSRVKKLDGLLLSNKLNEDLAISRISDNLLSEDKIVYALDKDFRDDIRWKQTNKYFWFLINNVITK